jgi:Uma2 family endonuclease
VKTTVRERFTVQDYDRLPEGFPAQLIAGFLVKEPSPTYGHQGAVQEIQDRLWRLIGKARTRPGPVGVRVDRFNEFHPDVAAYADPPPADDRHSATPIAVFEVLSPSTRAYDRGVKREKYFEAGVKEVWLLDGRARTVEVHTPSGSRIAREGERAESAAIPGFSLTPAEAFG